MSAEVDQYDTFCSSLKQLCFSLSVKEWGAGLMETLPKTLDYIIEVGRDVAENKMNW